MVLRLKNGMKIWLERKEPSEAENITEQEMAEMIELAQRLDDSTGTIEEKLKLVKFEIYGIPPWE